MNKFFPLLLLCLFVGFTTNAQDARFSQIGSAPLQLNPALCGRFDGQMRANMLLSWQKSGAAYVQHQQYSIDGFLDSTNNFGLAPNNSATNAIKSNWAGGIHYYQYGNDVLGFTQNTSPLKANFLSVTLAKHFYRNNIALGIGTQITAAHGQLNENNTSKLDPEIIGGGFRYSVAGQGSRTGTKNYLDMNVGAYFGMKNDLFSFELGGAIYHVAAPKNDVYEKDSDSRMRRRVTFYAVNRFNLNQKWALIQKNIYWSEGLYWNSNAQNDSSKNVTLWSGLEFHKMQHLSNYYVNFSIYTRSFSTLMPCVMVHAGPSICIQYSFEFPINSTKYRSYTADRTELSIRYLLKQKGAKNQAFNQFNYW